MSCTEIGSGGGGGGGGDSDDGGSGASWEMMGGLPELPPLDGLGLAVALVLAAVVLLIVLVGFALRVWVHAGYLRLHEVTLRDLSEDMGALFSGADRFAPMALWKLLKTAILMGVLAVAALPGGAALAFGAFAEQDALMAAGGVGILLIALPALIYVALGLTLGECAVVFEELGPLDALDRSWELARGHRVDIFLFLLVFGLFQVVAVIAGILMLCVGVLVTLPLAYSMQAVAFTEGYLLLARTPEETDAWAIWGAAG